MLRKIIASLILVSVISVCKASSAYKEEVAHFYGVRQLFVNYDYNGKWKSRVYSHHMQNGRKCLIVYTHGCIDYNGTFRICIGNEQSKDYVFALENELIYWHNRGQLDIRQFDHIHFGSCYCGYMSSEFTLPRLNKRVYVISRHTGITYYHEWGRSREQINEIAFSNVY